MNWGTTAVMYARIHDEGTEVSNSHRQFKLEVPTMTLNSSCVSESEDRQPTTTVSAGQGLLMLRYQKESIQDLSPITASGRFPE